MAAWDRGCAAHITQAILFTAVVALCQACPACPPALAWNHIRAFNHPAWRSDALKALDAQLGGALSDIVTRYEFKGKAVRGLLSGLPHGLQQHV